MYLRLRWSAGVCPVARVPRVQAKLDAFLRAEERRREYEYRDRAVQQSRRGAYQGLKLRCG